jgi:hypothetical protein
MRFASLIWNGRRGLAVDAGGAKFVGRYSEDPHYPGIFITLGLSRVTTNCSPVMRSICRPCSVFRRSSLSRWMLWFPVAAASLSHGLGSAAPSYDAHAAVRCCSITSRTEGSGS